MEYNIETLALHAGYEVDATTLARAVPVHRTSSYVFKNAEHAANLFGLKEPGYIYSRLGNPTQDVLEKRVAALEGAPAALALASGTSAIFYSIINICSAGEEIVSATNLYGGTYTMFHDILPQFGITVKFVNPIDLQGFESAINAKTRAVFIETIGNPVLDVLDIKAVGDIAHKHNLPLIVDSTFTTPFLLRPIEHGADIVVHSLTKWLSGHGTGIGGIVVDAGKFNWKDPKFKLFNEPDGSYHGLRYAHDLGDLNPIAFIMRMRLVPLRNLGACIAPDNAWMFLQGIETLHLRMERHCENALKVAEFLSSHPSVDWVRYPGLASDPAYPLASRYLKNGFGGMVVFGVKGGRSAGEKFIDNLHLFSHLANVGDAKSLAIHPASTTHSQLSEEDQRMGGLSPELVRLSIGIENIKDIIKDIDTALAHI
ncbi:MAG: bifunctional O-acetylhomoserine aminocarboxypropyltransferase/cysteine synthase [Candidatus Margulisiibacteriota bacterium]|nr:MAG: O-acetylhomoserine aminocarboxypropyltransferase [Candidatus Margulisbacteria bacterium GWD2_39_127]OGI00907.1 MAG: O-acetylhomoserine aminocarboxypropyltransferase [Candidatus Margulisbacteria bacterium GWF2_38_17]OGI08763.1 MAG: O-acetylhomoserine aminocarboxypropyltransferase [Candidatus Margulisbacteria bacterium GWE2_39_32]PZM79475.1 MAG: bifunctional O-acetylhomoserine aminocarboxypropyltransferase/cysteine synthase [Candidatus Margulisiibacteriota bacterium]HAR63501.1 O-acetylhom